MKDNVKRVQTVSDIATFWGLSGKEVIEKFDSIIFNVLGVPCIDGDDYLKHRGILKSRCKNYVKQYDKSYIVYKIKEIHPDASSIDIDRFLESYKPLEEPFTLVKYMNLDSLVSEISKFTYENKTFTLQNLQENYGLKESELYILARYLEIPVGVDGKILGSSNFYSLAYFLDNFKLVKGDMLDVVKEKNLPKIYVRFLGYLVENVVYNYVKRGLEMGSVNLDSIKIPLTYNGEVYLPISSLEEYLKSNKVRVRSEVVSSHRLIGKLVEEINGFSYIKMRDVDTIVFWYKKGCSFSNALAIACGLVDIEVLNNSLSFYKLRAVLNKLVDDKNIKKAFARKLIKDDLVKSTYLAYGTVKVYDLDSLLDLIKTHLLGLSVVDFDDATSYISAYKFLEFLNEAKGISKSKLPKFVEFSDKGYQLVYKQNTLIMVSNDILLANVSLIDSDLICKYNEYINAKVNSVLSYVEGVVVDVQKSNQITL